MQLWDNIKHGIICILGTPGEKKEKVSEKNI